jgi:excisionase family DNA binding protein
MPDQSTSGEPDLLTITEAAELLRAPVATLRYWRHVGTGPRSFRVGRHVLYRRHDVETWIEAQREHGGSRAR